MTPQELPVRVAQAVHAMMVAYLGRDSRTILRTAEIFVYDFKAADVAATRRALAAGRRLGLTEGGRGMWIPTSKANDMQRALEAYVLGLEDAQ